MNYWVIVGEGGGFDEVKSVKSGASGAASGGISKTTVRMDDVSFCMGGDGKTKVFLCGEEAAPPDVFMLWGHYNEVFEGISRRLISLGARSINDIDAKRVVCSKLSTALVLEQAGIPQAKTMLVTSATPAGLVVKTVGLPAVLKPSDGAQGEGVVLLKTEDEVAEYLSRLPECGGRAVLAQECFPLSENLRCFLLLRFLPQTFHSRRCFPKRVILRHSLQTLRFPCFLQQTFLFRSFRSWSFLLRTCSQQRSLFWKHLWMLLWMLPVWMLRLWMLPVWMLRLWMLPVWTLRLWMFPFSALTIPSQARLNFQPTLMSFPALVYLFYPCTRPVRSKDLPRASESAVFSYRSFFPDQPY